MGVPKGNLAHPHMQEKQKEKSRGCALNKVAGYENPNEINIEEDIRSEGIKDSYIRITRKMVVLKIMFESIWTNLFGAFLFFKYLI